MIRVARFGLVVQYHLLFAAIVACVSCVRKPHAAGREGGLAASTCTMAGLEGGGKPARMR